jgi:hypothetical protein
MHTRWLRCWGEYQSGISKQFSKGDIRSVVARAWSSTYCEVLHRNFALVVVDRRTQEDESRILLDIVLQ